MTQLRYLAFIAVALLAAGCAGFGKKTEEYKSTSRPSQPLEVPPGLTAPTADDRFAIPDPRTQTSYSAYSQQRSGGTPAPAGTAVLPKVEGARIERAGEQRWLVVKGPPEAVWPRIREFWGESGFRLIRESPELGIMETDWLEDRSRIPQDIIRQAIGWAFDAVYSTNQRDKYRTRLEIGAEPGTTEVYVSHRGLEEVFTTPQKESTVWQPRPPDRGLEAEMLNRMMAKLGAPERVATAAPGAPAAPGAAPASASAAAAPANATLQGSALVVNDNFDRAWRRVGLALDRVGFTVEDRDRSKGLYYVRYVDPDADKPQSEESWADKLKFWKPAPKTAQPQYRIHVADSGSGMSQVEVQNMQGAAEASSTGKRILSLLYDQLK